MARARTCGARCYSSRAAPPITSPARRSSSMAATPRDDAMKALVYTGTREMTYQEAPAPRPAQGEVLIRVDAVGICGSDMHAWHGHDPRRVPPLILGHELAGEI